MSISPFVHWNHAAYDGSAPIPSLLPDSLQFQPITNDSLYEGAQFRSGNAWPSQCALWRLRIRATGRFLLRVVATDGTGPLRLKRFALRWHLQSVCGRPIPCRRLAYAQCGVRYTHFSAGLVEDKTDPRIGAALHIPRLAGWCALFMAVTTRRPATTVSGPLLQFAVDSGFSFAPLHAKPTKQREFGLTIPIHGWTLDFSNFQTHRGISSINDVLGNSNIFFPLTIERAAFTDGNPHCVLRASRNAFDVYLTYSNQMVEGAGVVTGGLLSDPSQLCDGGGFCYLDHDQHNTLSAGFHAVLPFRVSAAANLSYGFGFLDEEGPQHLPTTPNFPSRFPKPSANAFRRLHSAEYRRWTIPSG